MFGDEVVDLEDYLGGGWLDGWRGLAWMFGSSVVWFDHSWMGLKCFSEAIIITYGSA